MKLTDPIAGAFGTYTVSIVGDRVVVNANGRRVADVTVPNYGTAFAELMERPTAGLVATSLPDSDVILFYDSADYSLGYALNVQFPADSEWADMTVVKQMKEGI